MELNLQQKITLISKLIDHKQALSKVFDAFYKVAGCNPEAPLPDASWKAFDAYTDLVAETIGDKDGWLTWFIWENDCGQKGMKAGFKGKTKKVKTVEDLIGLIDKPKDCRKK